MIYTSYFGAAKKLPSNACLISIARFCKFFKGPVYHKLAPTKEILGLYKSGVIDDVKYVEMYDRDVLGKLNVAEVISDLLAIAAEHGKDSFPVLLCYEKNGDFCHRHIVADWLSCAIGAEEFEVE